MTLGCADKANPVLPFHGTPNPGGVNGGGIDSGAAQPDTRPVFPGRDTNADLASTSILYMLCDMLRQDCPNPAYACYLRGNVGRCLLRGDNSAGTCFEGAGHDPSASTCARGTTCILLKGSREIGACMPFCNVLSPVQCPLNVVCEAVPGQDPVGYCDLSTN